MKTIPFNRNIVFSAVLAVVAIAIINRITPPYVSPVFEVVVSKNRVAISNVHQPRDIVTSKTVKIDRISLMEDNRFRHHKLGDIGYIDDYFVDIDASFTVKKAGDYIFYIGSDDGFSFSVDGKRLCEWPQDRPYTVDSCRINLSEGEHKFKLMHFQGFGNSGLTMNYAYRLDGTQYAAGENSEYLKF